MLDYWRLKKRLTMTTTKGKMDAPLMSVYQRGNVMVPSLHPGGSSFAAANLALGEFEDPMQPRNNKEGTVLDWTPGKSLAGKRFNRKILQQYACRKTKIPEVWIPLVVGPSKPQPEASGKKMEVRTACSILQEESPLELIPMNVETYVRWDGTIGNKDKDAVFKPEDLELLSCASKREGDENTWMGNESLKMTELYLNEITNEHWECDLRTRKRPMLGFQVPRKGHFIGPTCTGRKLSQTITMHKKAEAKTGIKSYGNWIVKQTLVVMEHQLEDPDIGVYMIPVLHITTVVSKLNLGNGYPIFIEMTPDQCEINALWHEVFVFVAGYLLKELWIKDDTWKSVIWDDPVMDDERKNRLSKQIRSDIWMRTFRAGSTGKTMRERNQDMDARNAEFLLQPRIGVADVEMGMPIAMMLVLEHFGRQKNLDPPKVQEPLNEMNVEEDRKPAAKRSNEDSPTEEGEGPKKKRRIGHENLSEEGSVEEAKGFASGSSAGESSA